MANPYICKTDGGLWRKWTAVYFLCHASFCWKKAPWHFSEASCGLHPTAPVVALFYLAALHLPIKTTRQVTYSGDGETSLLATSWRNLRFTTADSDSARCRHLRGHLFTRQADRMTPKAYETFVLHVFIVCFEAFEGCLGRRSGPTGHIWRYLFDMFLGGRNQNIVYYYVW